MPQIPQFLPSGQVVRRRAVPTDFPAGRGEAAIGAALKDVAQLGAQIAAARDSTQFDAVLAGAATDVSKAAIDAQGDLEAFTKSRASILDDYRKQVPSRHRDSFDARMQAISASSEISVYRESRRQAIDQGLASLSEGLQKWADLEATSPDPAVARSQAMEAIASALEHDVISAQDAVKLRDGYEQEVAGSRLAFLMREDPELAVEEIRAEEGPFAAVSELEREKMLTQATNAVRAREREDRADEALQRRLEAEAAQDRSDASTLEALELLDKGELTGQWIRDNAELLGPSRRIQLTAMLEKATTPTLDPVYYNQVQRLAVEDPAKFARLELDPNRLVEQFVPLSNLQRTIRDEGRMSATDAFVKERVEEAIKVHGIEEGWFGAGEESEVQQAEFRRRVDEDIAELRQRLGRAPDKDEIRSVIDGLTLEVSTGRRGFFRSLFGGGDSRRRFELPRGTASEYSVPDVPAATLPALIDVLEDRGERIDEASLLELYQATITRLSEGGLPATPENALRLLELDLR